MIKKIKIVNKYISLVPNCHNQLIGHGNINIISRHTQNMESRVVIDELRLYESNCKHLLFRLTMSYTNTRCSDILNASLHIVLVHIVLVHIKIMNNILRDYIIFFIQITKFKKVLFFNFQIQGSSEILYNTKGVFYVCSIYYIMNNGYIILYKVLGDYLIILYYRK